MKLTALMWAALTVVVGVSLFLLKYEVQALEDELHATYAQIERDKSAIRVLRAEWTYLNDPGRLRRLSEQHLGFTAPTQTQIIAISQIPFKNGTVGVPEASVQAPMPVPAATTPTILREADAAPKFRINVPAFQEWPGLKALGFKTTLPVTERPSTLAALTARFQRLLPAAWAGTPNLQEPRR